jgi:hypothetical protein
MPNRGTIVHTAAGLFLGVGLIAAPLFPAPSPVAAFSPPEHTIPLGWRQEAFFFPRGVTQRLAQALRSRLGRPISPYQVDRAVQTTLATLLAEAPLSPLAVLSQASDVSLSALVDGLLHEETVAQVLAHHGVTTAQVLDRLPPMAQAAAQSYVSRLFATPRHPPSPTTEMDRAIHLFSQALATQVPGLTPRSVAKVLHGMWAGYADRHRGSPYPMARWSPAGEWVPRGKIITLAAWDMGMTPQELCSRWSAGVTLAQVAGARSSTAQALLTAQLAGHLDILAVRLLAPRPAWRPRA